jgi:hypothetical protein
VADGREGLLSAGLCIVRLKLCDTFNVVFRRRRAKWYSITSGERPTPTNSRPTWLISRQCRRAGVFIKALAAVARPVQPLVGRAEALLALKMEVGFGTACTQKKSQAGIGQAAPAARWTQRPGLLPQRRQVFCSFCYFRNTLTAKSAASS